LVNGFGLVHDLLLPRFSRTKAKIDRATLTLQLFADEPGTQEMSYETIWEPQGIYQKYWGYLSSPEIFDSFSEIHGDPRFTSIRYVVKDYVGVEVFDVGVKTLLDDRAFNRVAQHANPNIVVAVVTTNPQIIQASEIASSYSLDAYPRKQWPTLADARKWIEEVGMK